MIHGSYYEPKYPCNDSWDRCHSIISFNQVPQKVKINFYRTYDHNDMYIESYTIHRVCLCHIHRTILKSCIIFVIFSPYSLIYHHADYFCPCINLSHQVTRGDGENVSGTLSACVTCNFKYLARGPLYCGPINWQNLIEHIGQWTNRFFHYRVYFQAQRMIFVDHSSNWLNMYCLNRLGGK